VNAPPESSVDRQPDRPDGPVNLDNCDQEPIHIPGAIQPHGALVAFDPQGRIAWLSDNAPTLLPGPGLGIGGHVRELLQGPGRPLGLHVCDALASCGSGEEFVVSHELTLPTHPVDLILSIGPQGVIAEIEPREWTHEEVSHFALQAHRGLDRLRRTSSVDALLQRAVDELRALTGFHRVMAYRFRHDNSGDIVAESRADGLESLVGRRYPATDIPAQARRLYLLNTLRLIVDVAATPMPLCGAAGSPPLDMSHSVLRSVSPIHIEYLRNMGVGASMSISIVIDGRLWGMFACHHMARRWVPHSIRMAADVLTQVVASTIATLTARAHAQRVSDAHAARKTWMVSMREGDTAASVLAAQLPWMAQILGADAAFVSHRGTVTHHGLDSTEVALVLSAFLQRLQGDPKLVALSGLTDWPEGRPAALAPFCGLIAHGFDAPSDGWLAFLRKEQVETVRWGHQPEKAYRTGPHGPRLTPPGSFQEWRETVAGLAEPWTDSDHDIFLHWIDDLQHAVLAHQADLERARTHLMAVLGHDLRDPLNAISLAAHVLQRTGPETGAALGQRIQRSAGRMQRLISLVLDMTRIRTGLGLGLNFTRLDMSELVRQAVDERQMAQADAQHHVELPDELWLMGDADRLIQVVANLLSNACHHSPPGTLVRVDLQALDSEVSLTVRNKARPIPPELVPALFDPFKRGRTTALGRSSGLGLGLYIADQIAREHGGSLTYRHEDPDVVFELRLPRSTGAGRG
jgi:two-component system, chemotaxis family, sensor kinase Cph1